MAYNPLEVELLTADIANMTAKMKELTDKRNALLACTDVKCKSCSTVSEIKTVTYYRTHWYESPHGCTGGDNWWAHEDEFKWDCPHCGQRHRELRNFELMRLRSLFKEVKELHER